MRKLLTAALFVLVISSFVSAEILITAPTVGQGKWGVEVVGLRDSNVGNSTNCTSNTYALKGAYGIAENMEIDVAYGLSSYSGLALGISDMSTGALIASFKYCLLTEGKDVPASVAVGLGYKSLSQKVKIVGGAEVNSSGSKRGVGVIVSKMMVPFIPYGGATYNAIDLGGANQTNIDLTLGTAIAWSTQGAAFVEYTLQSINAAGTSYTTPQIGVGVAYTI